MMWEIVLTDEVKRMARRPSRTPPRIRECHRGADLVRLRPWRSTILLVAGDKADDWSGWYRDAISHAEQLYENYLKERADEEEPPP